MYSESAHENIRALAMLYAKANNMTLTAVSRKIYGNVQFLPKFLKNRRSVSVRIADKLIERFSDDWPANVPWPPMVNAIITRPGPKGSKNGR